MRRLLFSLVLASVVSYAAGAQEIVKKGLNFGPLPAIAYDADKGFQLGAILQIFNYGDGHNYPNYDNKIYLEASFFTKGSMLFQAMYDDKELIPGVRWTTAVTAAIDKGMDFFGFNGYSTIYNFDSVNLGKVGDSFIYTPFYKMRRTQILGKSDFVGNITDHFKWEAGYHIGYFDQGSIDYDNINKGKSESQAFPKEGDPRYVGTLYEKYLKWGLISPNEASGGLISSIRAGLVYDTRDKEGAPSRGIWADAHVALAPKWLGTKNPFARYSLTFRQYLPFIKNDVLTFAYRLNYEGTFGNDAPYYVLPYITVQGENWDRDGMGGYRSLRGIMRNRVVGLDMFTYTAELRWRFVKFSLWNQNIALGLNIFSDGSMVTRGRDLSFKYSTSAPDYARELALYKANINSEMKDSFHITAGAGFRFIMNENFIVAFEYGTPISHFTKSCYKYNQDGTGAFYVNIGYLF